MMFKIWTDWIWQKKTLAEQNEKLWIDLLFHPPKPFQPHCAISKKHADEAEMEKDNNGD